MIQPTKKLLLANPEADAASLLLFWETACPLRRVLNDLPQLSGKFPMEVTPVVPSPKISGAVGLTEILNSAVSATLTISLPNLPEPLFERLALRFRPFYAENEETSFTRVMNILARRNEELRTWTSGLKSKWKRAAFWGAMGLSTGGLRVNAEDVIRVGFYSPYFHVERPMADLARQYERTLGVDMFRVAVISSVWQRSLLVADTADSLEEMLIALELATPEHLASCKLTKEDPASITLTVEGRAGCIQVRELE